MQTDSTKLPLSCKCGLVGECPKHPTGTLGANLHRALYEVNKCCYDEESRLGIAIEHLEAAIRQTEQSEDASGRARQITEHQALALIQAYNGGLAVVDAMLHAGLNWPPICDALQHARWCSEERPCAYNDAPNGAVQAQDTLTARIGMYMHDHGLAAEVSHVEAIIAMCRAEQAKDEPCSHVKDADALIAASRVPYLLENYPVDSARLEDYASELQNDCECDKK